ncbi:MAG: phage adaptor protein [Candidatus Heimdallarchaeaceae archaeon]
MKFNDATNETGICQDVWFLTGTDSTSFPLKDLARIANKVYHRLALLAWRSDNRWDFDDSNKTDLPIATDDLVDGQEDYAIPTTAFDIKRVEIKNSSGDWVKLRRITHSKVKEAMDEFHETKGVPTYYLLEGSSIRLKPAPDTTQVTASEGLKIHMARDVTEFVSTDTTKTPGFPTPLHQLFSHEIALEYAGINGLKDKFEYLSAKVGEGRQAFIDYFSHRGGEVKTTLKPKIVDYE